ncbi:enoyl-CoA hydratase/isomerase family protein [Planctomycetota bacterium]
MADLILIETQADIHRIYLQAGKNNAISKKLVQELQTSFDILLNDNSCRAVILTSKHDKFFSPGLDLFEISQFSREQMKSFMAGFGSLLQQIYNFPKPVIAAINGHAVAGGFCLALACDLRIMQAANHIVGLNELRFGVVLPFGVVQLLRDAGGSTAARQMAYFGSNLTPQEALQKGFIDRVVPVGSLHDTAFGLASELGSKIPAAFATIKRFLKHAPSKRILEYEEKELESFLDIWFSEETQQRIKQAVMQLGQ